MIFVINIRYRHKKIPKFDTGFQSGVKQRNNRN
jgi:hypothetical protein